jgi:hypothetical protein
MRQINIPVSDEVYEAAKKAARDAGMLFRAWVERAMATAVGTEAHDKRTIKLREPVR